MNALNPLARHALLAAVAAAVAAPVAAKSRQDAPPPRVEMPTVYVDLAPSPGLPVQAIDRWWMLFGDASLDALEAEAFRAAPDALTAGARIVEARQTGLAQRLATYPSGAIAGQASHQRSYEIGAPADDLVPTSGVIDQVSGAFNVSWELDLFGRLATQRRIARATQAEALFNVEGTWAGLAAAVADADFQARGLVIQLEDARQTVRIDRDLLDVARRKAAAGAGPDIDIDRIAAQTGQAEAQAAELKAQLDDARRRLLILVGRDLRELDALSLTDATPPVPPAPTAIPADLLARRPDVREAEYRLRAELGAAHLAHLAVFPTITLLPALGVSSVAQPGVSFIPPTTLVTSQQTTSAGFWTLAAGFSQPTLDIPRLLHQARAEDARSREAAIAYQASVRTAFGEAQAALTDLVASETATRLLDASEARAHTAYEGTRRGYAQGVDDLTTTLTAEQSWRAIRSADTGERVNSLRLAVRVYKALGGGWNFAAAPPAEAGR